MNVDKMIQFTLLQGLRDKNDPLRWKYAWEIMERGLDDLKIEARVLCLICLGDVDKLAELGEPAVPALAGFLKDNSEDARVALKALLKIGPAGVPALAECLKDEDICVRHAITQILVELGPPAVPALVRCMRKGNLAYRIVGVLDTIGINKIESIDDRVYCHFTLGNTDEVMKLGEAAVPTLVNWIKYGDALGRQRAIGSLWNIGLDKLRGLSIDDQVFCLLSMDSSDELVKLGPAAVPSIIAFLEHEMESVRLNAVKALKRIAYDPECDWKAAIPRLVEILKDPRAATHMRAEIMDALVIFADKHPGEDWKCLFPTLLECLDGGEGLPGRAAGALLKLCADMLGKEEKIRCLTALNRTGELLLMGADAVPILAGNLSSLDRTTRECATHVLEKAAEISRLDLRSVEKALAEYVDAARRKDDPLALRVAMKEATESYRRITDAVRARLAKEGAGMDGVLLEGERPRPPLDKKMYRAGRETARAVA